MSDDIETLREFINEAISHPLRGDALDDLARLENEMAALRADRDSLRAKLERAIRGFDRVREVDMRRAGSNGEDSFTYDGPSGKVAAGVISDLSADAPAEQTQISDEACKAAQLAYDEVLMDHRHWFDLHAPMRAAITTAIEWRK